MHVLHGIGLQVGVFCSRREVGRQLVRLDKHLHVTTVNRRPKNEWRTWFWAGLLEAEEIDILEEKFPSFCELDCKQLS